MDQLNELFREAMARLAAGVTVVTVAERDGTPRGLTMTSVTSFSSAPPSILASVAHTAKTHAALVSGRFFGVQILATGQEELARDFARRDDSKFGRYFWRMSAEGVPLLEGTMASLVCAKRKSWRHGDHTILIGDVTTCLLEGGTPLVYFDRRFWSLPLGMQDPAIPLMGTSPTSSR